MGSHLYEEINKPAHGKLQTVAICRASFSVKYLHFNMKIDNKYDKDQCYLQGSSNLGRSN